MAGIIATGGVSAVTLTASTTLSLIQLIAASNHRVKVQTIDISFNGITQADPPILVEVLLQTTAGTSSSLTLAKLNAADDETLQTTGLKTFSAEPTASTIIHAEYIHEQSNSPLCIPIGMLQIVGGTRLGVRVTPGTLTATTKASCNIIFEE